MNSSKGTQSGLEDFLQEQREGESAGEGSFSISRAAALEKLANFQLPFEGAWAVKIVEGLVASGTRQEIRATLGRQETAFSWSGHSPWTASDFQAAFLSTDDVADRGLEALLVGLRVVAQRKSHEFKLRLGGMEQWLCWSGSTSSFVSEQEEGASQGTNLLVVRHGSAGNALDWIAAKLRVSRAHRDVATALESRCFTCPVPLWLDGRRIDGIPHCPGHGLEKNSWPLSLRVLKVDGPRFRLPSADSVSLALAGRLRGPRAGMGLEGVTDALKALVTAAEASALMLLTAHLNPSATSHNKTRPPQYLTPTASHVFWVRHGVVVEVEDFPKQPRGVSVALFLNADGIDSDLSTFGLRKGALKARRFSHGTSAVKKALKSFVAPADQVKETNRRRYRNASHYAITACAVGGGLLGISAFGWTILPFVGVGAVTLLVAGEAEPHYEQHVLEQLEEELDKLGELFGKGRG